MSENEQKAGCVDGLEIFEDGYGQVVLSITAPNGDSAAFIVPDVSVRGQALLSYRAALEAAALSPARSGEAVGYVYSEVQDDGTRIKHAALQGKHAQTLANGTPLYAAPRNESSGVSPGGGEDNFISRWSKAIREMPMGATPAPQDSVRVGGGRRALILAKVEGYELGRNQASDFAKATDPVLAQSIRLNWHSDLPPTCGDCGGRGFQTGWVRTHEDDGYEVERDCPTCDAAGVIVGPFRDKTAPFVASEYGMGDLTVRQLTEMGYSVHVEPATTPAPAAGADGRDLETVEPSELTLTDVWVYHRDRSLSGTLAFDASNRHAFMARAIHRALSDGAGQSAGGGA